MKTIEEYLETIENEDIVNKILYYHSRFINIPHVRFEIKYRLPFYYGNSWICYFNVIKNNQLELCFTRGFELSNHQGILEARGRKQIKGLHVLAVPSSQTPLILEIFQEALLLDEIKPYKLKS